MRTRHQKPRTKEQLQWIVDDFNTRWPVGTHVMLRLDFDSGEVLTKVRAAAEIFGGHSAVAWFDGVSGAYSIEDQRVTTVTAEVA